MKFVLQNTAKGLVNQIEAILSKTEIRIHEFIVELEQGKDPKKMGIP